MANIQDQLPVKLTNGTDTAAITAGSALRVDGSAVTQPVSGTVTANQGTAQTAANGWPVRVSDGTNLINVGDNSNSAVRVNVVAGGGSGGTSSSFTAAFPATGTAAGYYDGTNMQGARVFDLDTGGGTQYGLGVNLRKSASGGSVEFGTSSDPIRVDPTGSTTQPISGTVTANAGTGNFGVNITQIAGSAVSTAATGIIKVGISDSSGSSITLGQQTMAASVPVVIASNQSAITISGTVTANIGTTGGLALDATLTGGTQRTRITDGTNNVTTLFDVDTGGGTQYVEGVSLRKAASGGSVELGTSTDPIRVDPTGSTTQPIAGTVTANQGTAAVATGGWPVRASDGTNLINFGDNSNSAVRVNLVASTAGTTGTSSLFGSSFPAAGTAAGFLDIVGSSMRPGSVFDLDTGAGDEYGLGVNLRKSASGGSVEFGTSSDPIRVDPTGSTTQPVSGTVTADAGTGTFTTNDNSNKAEDSGHTTGDIGSFVLAVRNDTDAALTTTDLDYSPISVDSAGRLKTTATGTFTAGAEKAEDSGHVTGATGNFVLAVRNDTAATLTTTDLDYSPFATDAAGRIGIADLGGSITVDGTVTANIGTTGGLALDATLTGGTTRVRNTDGTNNVTTLFDVDTGAGTQYVEGVSLRLSASGGSVEFGTATNPIRIDPTGTTTQPVSQTTASNLNAQVVGDVAHDTTDAGNPVKVGGQARTTNPTAVADADRANLITDDLGRLVTVNGHVRDLVVKQYTQLTTTTETTILTAGGAGVFHDIYSLFINNRSGIVVLTLREATGGTVVLRHSSTTRQNVVLTFDPPLTQTTANNNWTAQINNTETVDITVVAVKNV